MMSVDYHQQVTKRLGPSTPDFFRLFMVPGMFNRGGGVGASTFDQLGVIMNWVERGIAPDGIVASRNMDGKTVRTRPLCPNPESAKYKGAGSIDDASNFAWTTPCAP